MKKIYTYIITNRDKDTLFVSTTDNLAQRISDHKEKTYRNKFVLKNRLEKLVYYEALEDMELATLREKQIKSWSKNKTKKLINKINPEWNDLYNDITTK